MIISGGTDWYSDVNLKSRSMIQAPAFHLVVFQVNCLRTYLATMALLEDPFDDETQDEYKQRLIYWLQQMMFVSGETAEPSAETTWMIEEIVREQVVEMVCPSIVVPNCI